MLPLRGQTWGKRALDSVPRMSFAQAPGLGELGMDSDGLSKFRIVDEA